MLNCCYYSSNVFLYILGMNVVVWLPMMLAKGQNNGAGAHTHIHKLLNRIKNSSVYSCLSLTGLKSIDLLLGLLIHIGTYHLSLSVLSLEKRDPNSFTLD